MSHKNSKSIQAIIITFIAGKIIPKAFDIVSNALLDKLLWKGILNASFAIATFVVGVLYTLGIISGRVTGGKSRIVIYFISIALLAYAVAKVCAFVQEILPMIKIALFLIAIFATIWVIGLMIRCCSRKKELKKAQKKSAENNCLLVPIQPKQEVFEIAITPVSTSTFSPIATAPDIVVTSDRTKNKTLYQLWHEKGEDEKCLTVTNDENPDLEWIKIYKPPYRNGKFYGYILMRNARNTVNGEIYFASRAIWKRC